MTSPVSTVFVILLLSAKGHVSIEELFQTVSTTRRKFKNQLSLLLVLLELKPRSMLTMMNLVSKTHLYKCFTAVI